MTFLFYFSCFLTTLVGFLLGKATKEEHDEIKYFVRLTHLSLFLINIIFLIFLIQSKVLTTFFIILTIITFYYKDYNLMIDFSYLLMLSNSFFLYQVTQHPYLIVLPIFSLVLANSVKDFNLKEQIYSFLLLFILYFILKVNF